MKVSALVYISMLVLIKTAAGLFDDGCKYEYQVAAEKCIKANIGLEEKINHLESMQARNVERVNTISLAYNEEFNVLARDTGSLKTVTNRLVEDSVKMEGKMRILQDVGSDVRGLRNKVTTESKKMTEMVSDVAGRLERQASAQTMITAKMSSQMRDNKEILAGLQSKITMLEEKLGKAGSNQQGNTGSSNTEHLEGQVAELTSKLDSNIEFFNGQIEAIIANIQQVQKQLMSRK